MELLLRGEILSRRADWCVFKVRADDLCCLIFQFINLERESNVLSFCIRRYNVYSFQVFSQLERQIEINKKLFCVFPTGSIWEGCTHLGMLGGALFGRLGACGLSALLLKGPRGPGRFGGGGAPRGAGRWPEDILLGAVGLGGGDLGEDRTS